MTPHFIFLLSLPGFSRAQAAPLPPPPPPLPMPGQSEAEMAARKKTQMAAIRRKGLLSTNKTATLGVEIDEDPESLKQPTLVGGGY